MSLPHDQSSASDTVRVYNENAVGRPSRHPFIAWFESHPALSLACPDSEFVAELMAHPVYCLASRISVQHWELMFRCRAPSHVHAQQWHVYDINVGLRQRRSLLARSALCEALVIRMICVQGTRRVKHPLRDMNCIVSQRHFLGFKNQAVRLFQDGLQLYGESQFNEAARSWGLAALLAHAESHAFLSSMLLEGRQNVPKDHKRAFELASAGAMFGCAHSKGVLGQCYTSAINVAKDVATGLTLGRESAEAGSFFGQFVLAMCHHVGWEVEQDYEEAARLYAAAAAHGHPVAQCNLGVMFDHGQVSGHEDPAEAARLWRQAAAQGYAGAQFNMGVMYERGRGVRIDTAEAVRWYRLAAASQGDGDGRALALQGLRRLGVFMW